MNDEDKNEQMVPYDGPPRAMVMLTENPEDQTIEMQCATEPSYDPKNPSHAVARYIGDHFHEITQLVKQARVKGELPQGVVQVVSPDIIRGPNG